MAQTYFIILTLLGKAKVAEAIANGTDIGLSQVAVGDGDYTPSEGQTALVSEKYRAGANQVYRDEPENPNWTVVELVIPAEIGGWNVREVGIFDAAGDLFAIGKYAPTYKPTFEEGSGKELVIRAILEISSQANVTVTVDPSVVLATREYVDDEIDGDVAAHAALDAAHPASKIVYDPTVSGLAADRVQGAVDEIAVITAELVAALPRFDVRLSYVSATQIKLDPHNGARLWIDGANRLVNLAGVTKSNSGLSANTHYFVYAYWSGSVVALELVPTAPTLYNGVKVKTGDTSRSLVGQLRTNAGIQFTDDLVSSYYNRRLRTNSAQFTATRSTASASYTQLHSEIVTPFLSWGDEETVVMAQGPWWAATAAYQNIQAIIAIDGAAVAEGGNLTVHGSSSVERMSFSVCWNNVFSLGYHTADLWGAISPSGTVNFGGASQIACRNQVIWRG